MANLQIKGVQDELYAEIKKLAYNLTLVTNNPKHFERIQGLKATNWTVYPEC